MNVEIDIQMDRWIFIQMLREGGCEKGMREREGERERDKQIDRERERGQKGGEDKQTQMSMNVPLM